MCMDSWGRSSYARAMVELRASVKLKYTIVVVVPKFVSKGYTMRTIRVEYEWIPRRCYSCKNSVSTSGKKKQARLSRQELVEKGDNAGVISYAHRSLPMAFSIPNTTPLAEKINNLERQMLVGKLMLMDDDVKPINKVDYDPVNVDSDRVLMWFTMRLLNSWLVEGLRVRIWITDVPVWLLGEFMVLEEGDGRGVKEKSGAIPSTKPVKDTVVVSSSIVEEPIDATVNTEDVNVRQTPTSPNVNPKPGTSYPNLFTNGPSRKATNYGTLFTSGENGVDMIVSVESIRAISARFANTVYGFCLGKHVAYPFSSMDGLDAMLENGPWFIRNNPLILKKWNPDVNLLKEDVGNVLVWVKLHGVPVTSFSEHGLSAIATKLGTPLMLDSYTSDTGNPLDVRVVRSLVIFRRSVPRIQVPRVLVTCRIDNFQIQFGREEFCLVIGLKFGVENWTDYNDDVEPIPFRRRVFSSSLDGQPIRGKHVESLINSEAFKKLDDNDVVSLCCVGILQLVLLGLEDRRPVPNWILRLANDRDGWDNYPWGSHVWPTLYKQLKDANVRRWPALYATQPRNEDEVEKKSYSLVGFLWAFKTWILESFRAATNDYYTRYRRLPRIVAWSSKNKFYLRMLRPFLHGQLPVERLIPDEIEARSPWWVSSRAYFDGRNIEDERIPRHLNRNNYFEVPSEMYREFKEQRRGSNVLMKLHEALDEKAILEEQILTLMHRFADRFTDRRVEINNLMVLHDHPLIDYGKYALGCMTGADMKKCVHLKSVRDELLRSMEEKRQLMTNYRDM
ncbi:phospholipase-like protein [Tanacetum coccineum]